MTEIFFRGMPKLVTRSAPEPSEMAMTLDALGYRARMSILANRPFPEEGSASERMLRTLTNTRLGPPDRMLGKFARDMKLMHARGASRRLRVRKRSVASSKNASA